MTAQLDLQLINPQVTQQEFLLQRIVLSKIRRVSDSSKVEADGQLIWVAHDAKHLL